MGKGKKQLKRARRDAAAAAAGDTAGQRPGDEREEEAELASLGFDDALAAGMAFEQLGALEAAVEAFEVALRRRPGHVEALTRLADALSASEDHAGAVDRYKEASRTDAGSRDASVWFRLGMSFSALDKDADAVDNLRKAVALSEEEAKKGVGEAVKAYSVALAALANCHGEQGDLDAAVRVFRDATAALPGNGNLHYNLANMLMARAGGSFDEEVIAALERAIECSPDTPDFYGDLAEYLAQHKRAEDKVKALREKATLLEAAVAKEENAGGKKRKRVSDEESEHEDEDSDDEDEEAGEEEEGDSSSDDDREEEALSGSDASEE